MLTVAACLALIWRPVAGRRNAHEPFTSSSGIIMREPLARTGGTHGVHAQRIQNPFVVHRFCNCIPIVVKVFFLQTRFKDFFSCSSCHCIIFSYFITKQHRGKLILKKSKKTCLSGLLIENIFFKHYCIMLQVRASFTIKGTLTRHFLPLFLLISNIPGPYFIA